MHNATPLRVSIDGLGAVGVARQTTDLPKNRTDSHRGHTGDTTHKRSLPNTTDTHREAHPTHTTHKTPTTFIQPPRALAERDPDQWMRPSPASPNSGPPKCPARPVTPATPQVRRENRRFAGPWTPLAGPWGAKPLVVEQQSTRDRKIRPTMQPLMLPPCSGRPLAGSQPSVRPSCATGLCVSCPVRPHGRPQPFLVSSSHATPGRPLRGTPSHQGAHQGHSKQTGTRNEQRRGRAGESM